MMAYADLSEIRFVSHSLLQLYFTDSTFEIEGESLYALIDHFLAEKIIALGCFSAEDGTARPEEGMPIITHITRTIAN